MKFSWLLISLMTTAAQAQVNPGPRFTAMAATGVAMQDSWSLQQNQAGLTGARHPSVSVGFEKLFLGQEVSTQSALFILPYKQQVFGLSFQRYGFSAYNQQQIALAYARDFGNVLSLALDINFHQLQIKGYGSSMAYSVEAGVQYKLNAACRLGAHIANPGQSGFEKGMDALIPVKMEFGVSYQFSDKVLLAAAVEKTLNFNADVRSGLEYRLIDWLALRGGISANPFKQYAGFGLNYQKFRLDMAAQKHASLGYAPQIALAYEF